ncbi:MAG: MarR family winged helix-turn-helix transcriptional regulator [Acidimicrobiales bacterium]
MTGATTPAGGGDGGVTEPASAEAWRLVYALVLEGEAHSRLHETCRQVGMPPNLVKTLLVLDREQPVAMRDLADRFNVDASYCTTLVDNLEEHGVARRRAHPSDRRVKTVVLTDKGRRVLAQARATMGAPPPAFSSLGPTDQRRLRDLLAKVADADAVLGPRRRAPEPPPGS